MTDELYLETIDTFSFNFHRKYYNVFQMFRQFKTFLKFQLKGDSVDLDLQWSYYIKYCNIITPKSHRARNSNFHLRIYSFCRNVFVEISLHIRMFHHKQSEKENELIINILRLQGFLRRWPDQDHVKFKSRSNEI